MRRWEKLEDWINDQLATGRTTFSNWELAVGAGITTAEASGWIKAYQTAQKVRGQTAHFIHRTGRTTSAVWNVGSAAQDVRGLSAQAADDMTFRITSVVVPTIEAIADANPRARKQAVSTGVQVGRVLERLAGM